MCIKFSWFVAKDFFYNGALNTSALIMTQYLKDFLIKEFSNFEGNINLLAYLISYLFVKFNGKMDYFIYYV